MFFCSSRFPFLVFTLFFCCCFHALQSTPVFRSLFHFQLVISYLFLIYIHFPVTSFLALPVFFCWPLWCVVFCYFHALQSTPVSCPPFHFQLVTSSSIYFWFTFISLLPVFLLFLWFLCWLVQFVVLLLSCPPIHSSFLSSLSFPFYFLFNFPPVRIPLLYLLTCTDCCFLSVSFHSSSLPSLS